MDFKAVLGLILEGFHKENIRYGLIGGFALGALGLPRATVDLDFLVHREDLGKLERIMKSNGYDCAYKSENVSQYVSPLKIFGEVDFLHAFRKISLGMLERAKELDVFEGKFKIRVLTPEDIIGLKLQAIANDPARATQEYLDIEALMSRYAKELDWDNIGDYFSIFEQKDKFLELKAKYCDVQ